MNPMEFLQKIPNRSVCRDFFVNKCKFYCPPQKDLTAKFIKVTNYYFFIIIIFRIFLMGKRNFYWPQLYNGLKRYPNGKN